MDSSESPTYGEHEGSAFNGHFGCTSYHPLFVFNQFGDVERCALRKERARSNGRACHAAPSQPNALRLQLHAPAYNLGNLIRTLRCPRRHSRGR
jgi:hypothetical protein